MAFEQCVYDIYNTDVGTVCGGLKEMKDVVGSSVKLISNFKGIMFGSDMYLIMDDVYQLNSHQFVTTNVSPTKQWYGLYVLKDGGNESNRSDFILSDYYIFKDVADIIYTKVQNWGSGEITRDPETKDSINAIYWSKFFESFGWKSYVVGKLDTKFDKEYAVPRYISQPNNTNLTDWDVVTYSILEGSSKEPTGVIYRMIDEFGNDCPYDFKNIQFARWELSNPVGYSRYYESDHGETFLEWEENEDITDVFKSIKLGFYGLTYLDTEFYLGKGSDHLDPRYRMTYDISSAPTYCYTFGKDEDYSLNGDSHNNIIKEHNTSNKTSLNNIVFIGDGCYSNTFGNECYDNTFGGYCYSNSFGNYCYNVNFSQSCQYNTFGENCYNNTFADHCASNCLFNDCCNNTFCGTCTANTLFNSCTGNCLGFECYKNSFGNGCYSNSFGDGCYSNTFGNGCGENVFSNDCWSNTFGNDCNNNNFDSVNRTVVFYTVFLSSAESNAFYFNEIKKF